MPWCSNTVWVDNIVLSCPPCWVAVEVKTLRQRATLQRRLDEMSPSEREIREPLIRDELQAIEAHARYQLWRVELLVGSNNYIANQVFLEVGAQRLGAPVSLDKSLKAANDMLAAHDLAQSIRLEEGSGISRGNSFTPRGLAKVLALLAPHADLLKRSKGAAYKTGTFEGVRTLAGYLDTPRHGRVRFVIALEGNNSALRLQLMRAIQAALQIRQERSGRLPDNSAIAVFDRT